MLTLVHSTSQEAGRSDADLVMRAREGDRHAEESLYRRHLPYVTALCQRLLGSQHEAEDAVQDTFVDMLEQLGALRDPESLRPWLTRIAVHKVHRRFRRRKLLRVLGLNRSDGQLTEVLVPGDRATPEQSAELRRLELVLAGIPDEQRAAWVLRYVDGHKLEEVAVLCECSLATAKRRISAADCLVRAHVAIATSTEEADAL